MQTLRQVKTLYVPADMRSKKPLPAANMSTTNRTKEAAFALVPSQLSTATAQSLTLPCATSGASDAYAQDEQCAPGGRKDRATRRQ